MTAAEIMARLRLAEPALRALAQRIAEAYVAIGRALERIARDMVAKLAAFFPPRPTRPLSRAAAEFKAKYDAGRWRGQRKVTKAFRRLRRVMEAG